MMFNTVTYSTKVGSFLVEYKFNQNKLKILLQNRAGSVTSIYTDTEHRWYNDTLRRELCSKVNNMYINSDFNHGTNKVDSPIVIDLFYNIVQCLSHHSDNVDRQWVSVLDNLDLLSVETDHLVEDGHDAFLTFCK